MSALREWVEALESGEYAQARESLMVVDSRGEPSGYCCLGVAADICPLVERLDLGFVYIEEPETEECEYVGDLTAELDRWTREWLGISSEEEADLIKMNDEENLSFPEIAQQVRNKHPKMFLKGS